MTRKNIALALPIALACMLLIAVTACDQASSQGKQDSSLDQSEELLKKYSASFEKSGAPTPSVVEASFRQAETQNTVDAWQRAARLANSYANVIDVLCEHYSGLYHSSRSAYSDGDMSYLSTAADYERKRNVYLAKRNDAYLRMARLHLEAGDKASALSLAVTAVELSGAEPNEQGEALIKEIVEYR